MSAASRTLAAGGKMYVPRATYSLSTSFWTVPFSFSGPTPCFSAAAMYIASITAAGALIVMLVETLSSGMSSKSVSMSYRESIATPTWPTSAMAIGSSES